MTAWLEIAAEKLIQIQAHPTGGVTALHDALMVPTDLDSPAPSFRNKLVHDSKWTVASSPPALELRPRLDAVADRVIRQRTQRFESQVHEYYYAIGRSDGVLRVAGQPPGVLPTSVWGPLRARLVGGLSGGFVVLGLAMVVMSAYTSRAAWFRSSGSGEPMLLAGLVAALAASLLVTGVWLPARLRSLPRMIVPASVLVLAWIAIVGSWFVGTPRLESVVAALDRGELEGARLEAEALMVVRRDPETEAAIVRLEELEAARQREHEDAEDDEHLRRIQDAATLRDAVVLLDGPWHHDRLAVDARTVVHERAMREVADAFERDDEATLREIAGLSAALDDALSQRARRRAVLARARSCHASRSLDCAVDALGEVSFEKDDPDATVYAETRSAVARGLVAEVEVPDIEATDLDTRAEALRKALDSAKEYEAFVGSPAPRSVASLQTALTATEQKLARERAKQEAAAAKQRAAEERRAAATEKRAQRAATRSSWSAPSDGGCCKYCSKGKPCGDTCIAQNKTCHKGAGCAC